MSGAPSCSAYFSIPILRAEKEGELSIIRTLRTYPKVNSHKSATPRIIRHARQASKNFQPSNNFGHRDPGLKTPRAVTCRRFAAGKLPVGLDTRILFRILA